MSDRIADLARAVQLGERRALARAITLVESSRPDHRAGAVRLLGLLRGGTGKISGQEDRRPGAGDAEPAPEATPGPFPGTAGSARGPAGRQEADRPGPQGSAAFGTEAGPSAASGPEGAGSPGRGAGGACPGLADAGPPPGHREALRIGLSGTPGVGKSSFVEAFGKMLTGQGLKVAVLAVDPSSARSGGSILGDKTRMELLSRDPLAFIRPSPSQASLGGVARRTREAVALCEAAGFDVVIVETVGVGQSETLVAGMTDLFVLLMAPAGGDELQGVKRGIMEQADLILVNKADGDLLPAARRTAADYSQALRLLRRQPQDPPGYPQAMLVSSLLAEGLEPAWSAMQALARWRLAQGWWHRARAGQARTAFEDEVRRGLLARLESDPQLAARLARLGAAVEAGGADPTAAAAEVLAVLESGAGFGMPVGGPE